MSRYPRSTYGAIRINQGFLADLEKRVLRWLARRIPLWINSDHLSALGLAAMVLAGASFAAYVWTPYAAAAVALSLALNWFGDSLDGTLARVRGQQRPRYGYYVDHVIDLAGTSVLLAGVAYSGLMSPLVAVLVLAAYLLVAAETYLATNVRGVFRMSYFAVGPTELRIVLAAGAMRAAYDPWVSVVGLGPIRLFDAGGTVAATAFVAVFLMSSIRNTLALSAAEPRPAPPRDVAA